MADTKFSLANMAQYFTEIYSKTKGSFGNGVAGTDSFHNAGEPMVPREQGAGVVPFQNQFQVGANLITNPRGDQTALTPFQTLRALADQCDLVRLAIEMRKEQLSGMDWGIVNADEADKTVYDKDIVKARAFFNKPDGVNNFYDWLGMILEDVLVIDALTLSKRKTRGGEFYGLEVVDGATIKPLRDAWGRTPLAPLPAYQQVIYGYPQSEHTIDDMMYKPKNRRSWTPYGFAPVEYIMMTVNIALRKQQFSLGYFTEGNLPDGGIYGVPDAWTPAQIKQYQEYWDAMMVSNFKNRQRMRFVPKGTYTETKKFEFQQEFEEWLARVVCTAFQINSQPFLKFTNRATAQVSDDQQTDLGLKPLCIYLGGIFTEVLQAKNGLNMPHLKFKWTTEKAADETLVVDRNCRYVQAGIIGIDEVRIELGKEPLFSGGVPPYLMVENKPVFLTKEIITKMLDASNFQSAEEKQESALSIAESGAMTPKNGAATVGKPKQGKAKDIDEEQPTDGTEAEKAVSSELKRWEKFVVNRFGKAAGREFETELIPERVVKRIKQDLQLAETVDEIKAVFKSGTNRMTRENLAAVGAETEELKKD